MLLRTVIGATLRKERLAQKRSLRDIASHAHMSLGFLSELERGKKEASSEVLENICNALFMTPKDLLIETVVLMNTYESIKSDKENNINIERVSL